MSKKSHPGDGMRGSGIKGTYTTGATEPVFTRIINYLSKYRKNQ